MAQNDTLKKAPPKFLFDLHNFADNAPIEEPEDIEPPPPVFSEEELEAARKESYQRGKNDGLAEAANSREKFVSELLKTVSENFDTLYKQENARARLYEQEAVSLSLAIFKKLFPSLNEHCGLKEMKEVIISVLETQQQKPEIIINVHPEYVADIEKLAQENVKKASYPGTVSINEDDTLKKGECRLSWDNGHAYRDSTFLAEEIEKQIQEILAESSAIRDNKEGDDVHSVSAESGDAEEMPKVTTGTDAKEPKAEDQIADADQQIKAEDIDKSGNGPEKNMKQDTE